MHLFTDYIQPLTVWFYDHPNWALFITFLLSFAESLAIIGSFIPGTVAMTAIGILAGTGVMRIDLTLLSATLGAIGGDGLSYALGYIMSDRLTSMWPFRTYPSWLQYGNAFFKKHGASSIIIGRFIGPIRSVIPVIAGMLHMNKWHFILANIISGIIWATVYIIPGVLIGAASSELSAESATRLIVLILLLLVTIWFSTQAIKWLFTRINGLLSTHLHRLWMWLTTNAVFSRIAKHITPANEKNHYQTTAFVLAFVLSFLTFIVMTVMVEKDVGVTPVNNLVYLFFQSLRTQTFDSFFIVMGLIISPISLMTLAVSFAVYNIYRCDWRTLRYWMVLFFSSGITIILLTILVDTPEPNNLLRPMTPLSFPAKNLTFATSLIGFLILYINTHCHTFIMHSLRVLLMTILFLAGIGLVYLGDHWFISIVVSYFIGVSLCFIHWIYYRRLLFSSPPASPPASSTPLIICFILMAMAASLSFCLYFKKIAHAHLPQLKQYVMTEKVWWNQSRPLLPVYSTNRFGKRTGLLNIQYLGSIDTLQKRLTSDGWRTQSNSFFYSLLLRAGGHNLSDDLPLMAQLYHNRKPVLMMTYNLEDQKALIILRLWRSNYHLFHYGKPIWLGSLLYSSKAMSKGLQPYPAKPAGDYLIDALHEFDYHQVELPYRYLQALPYPVSPLLFIIKEPRD